MGDKTRKDEKFEEGFKFGKETGKVPSKTADGIEEGLYRIFGRRASESVREDNEMVRKGAEEGVKYHEESGKSSDSGSSSGGGSDSGGSLCYLTSACVNARGLPDNCLELKSLRNFRGKILLQNSIGRNRVREYYQIAPEIVQSINQRDNAKEIWNSLYKDIRKAVQLVLSENFNQAFEHYREMSLRLKERYL